MEGATALSSNTLLAMHSSLCIGSHHVHMRFSHPLLLCLAVSVCLSVCLSVCVCVCVYLFQREDKRELERRVTHLKV